MRTALAALASLALTLVAHAQPLGTGFTYQGRLDANGSPAGGAYDFRFTLFDAASNGTQVGPILCVDNLNVSSGVFTVQLDFGSQFAGQQRFLEIWVRAHSGVGCGSITGFTTLAPRQNLSGAPNALFSLSAANALNAGTAINAIQLNSQPASFYLNASNLTAGTLPDARLSTSVDLVNTAQTVGGAKTFIGPTYLNGFVGFGTTSPLGSANFVMSQTTSAFGGMYINTTGVSGQPFYGYAQGNSVAAFHYIDGPDSGKWKLNLNGATRLTVNTQGDVGIGTTSPSNHLTVSQEADTNCFLAINSGSTAAQSSGLRLNDRNTAYWSINKNSSNDFTIREVGAGADRLYIGQGGFVGIGTSIPTYPLEVDTTDPSGVSIFGTSTNTNSVGVYGESHGDAGSGVRGVAWHATGQNSGVYGATVSGSGYGVYSDGRFAATGTKSFQIDHPLDPENKYLNHYCEEGPEPLNVYRGTVLLDERGEATIDLPAYFSEINKDPSYTLTAVGAPMPALYVSREVADNRFSISGGVPNGKVCWRVEAARNDRFVRAYGAPIEQDKPVEHRGRYVQPALYDQPPEKGESFRPSLKPHAPPSNGRPSFNPNTRPPGE